MKQIILSLFLTVLTLSIAKAQSKFSLQIDYPVDSNYTIDLVSYLPYVSYEPKNIDSNTILFSGTLDKEFEQFRVVIRKNQKTNYYNFFTGGGKKSKIVIESLDKLEFYNLPQYNLQKEFWSNIDKYEKAKKVNYEIIPQLAKADSLKKDSIYKIIRANSDSILQKELEFIKKHPDSYFSLFYFRTDFLQQQRYSFDSLKSIYNKFSNKLNKTIYGKMVENEMNNLGSVQLCAFAQNISFYTKDSIYISLQDFKGQKNILLCFWASWCGPCIHSIPEIKKIYEEYNGKDLEIVSIAIDDPYERWVAAMEKYKMPWLQTNSNSAYMPNEDVKYKYAIPYIPQYILIDKEGKVAYNRIVTGKRETDNYEILRDVLLNILN